MIDVIELADCPTDEPLGLGCLRTDRGNLPLDSSTSARPSPGWPPGSR